MNHIDKEVLKTLEEKLQSEKIALVEELKTIAQQDPDNPANWQPLGDGANSQTSADPNKRADNIEEYEANSSIINNLETRLLHVNSSLDNIGNESYGVCSECSKEIPSDRLMANPAATTCVDHN
jgi:RNA polymerase-binding transcription factor DksA